MQIKCASIKWLNRINNTSFIGRWKYGHRHDMAVTNCGRARGYKPETKTTPFCKLGVFVNRILAFPSLFSDVILKMHIKTCIYTITLVYCIDFQTLDSPCNLSRWLPGKREELAPILFNAGVLDLHQISKLQIFGCVDINILTQTSLWVTRRKRPRMHESRYEAF